MALIKSISDKKNQSAEYHVIGLIVIRGDGTATAELETWKDEQTFLDQNVDGFIAAEKFPFHVNPQVLSAQLNLVALKAAILADLSGVGGKLEGAQVVIDKVPAASASIKI